MQTIPDFPAGLLKINQRCGKRWHKPLFYPRCLAKEEFMKKGFTKTNLRKKKECQKPTIKTGSSAIS